MKHICVFASSLNTERESLKKQAYELGKLIAKTGYTLVFGAGGTGLMGECARGCTSAGGRTLGIIPEFMYKPGVYYEELDETVVTATMHERKGKMETLADAFVALPGGFGTLEELFEVITLKQLGRHTKPVVILNANGYYDSLSTVFDQIYAEKLAADEFRILYYFAPDADSAINYIANYKADGKTPKLIF